MTEAELRAAIKSGPAGGYFFWGDEDYLKRYYLGALRRAVLADCPPGMEDFNRTVLTLEDADVSALAASIRSLPVMAPRRIIEVLPPTLADWTEKERRALLDVLAAFSAEGAEDTVLVLSVPRGGFDPGTPKKPSAFLREAGESLSAVEFPLQTGARLRRWIERHIADEGLSAADDAVAAMLERCAPDMDTLSGELEKLTAYVKSHGGTAVRREDVERATSPGMREDAFALANAVLAGDRRSALAALDLCRKRREDPIAVLGALSRVLSDLLTVAVMAEGGCGKAEIAQTLRMHEYKASLYLRAAADFGTARLNGALTRLLEADRLTKSGQSGYLPLERFICTLPVGAGFRRRPEAPS